MARRTRLPRVAVTLDPEAHALVRELAELTQASQSAVVGDLINTATPALRTMLDALRILKDQPHEAQRLLARQANMATIEVAQAQLDLDEHLDPRTVEGKRRRRAYGQT